MAMMKSKNKELKWKVIDFLEAHEGYEFSARAIANELDAVRSSVANVLNSLRNEGKVETSLYSGVGNNKMMYSLKN